MPSETSRKSVRFDEGTASHSVSSRSSASRSELGTESLYEQQALRQALQDAVNQIDEWKAKALDIEKQLNKTRRHADANLKEAHSQFEGEKKELQRDKKKLKDANRALDAHNAALQNENENLRSTNERLHKKLRDFETQPVTTSPKSSKPHRSDSKRAKESDADQQKDRLKGRFERGETSSDASSSRRSSSKAPRSRRMSHTSYPTERPYVEPLGPAAARPTDTIPTSPSVLNPPVGRRFDGPVAVSKTGQPVVSHYQDPAYSSTPRTTGLERPSVYYKYPNDPLLSPTGSYETGNYYPHPL